MVNSFVENIDINECSKLFFVKNSNFYRMCLQYNLSNLKEVFDFFDNNDIEIKNKFSYAEIHGILNILKFVYLNEEIIFWNKLNKKCAGSSGNKGGDKYDYLYLKYHGLLRNFGFTAAEAFEISEYLDYNDTIGNAIIRLYEYKLKNNYKILSQQQSVVTFKKLELFANYYMNFKLKRIEALEKKIAKEPQEELEINKMNK